MMQLSTERLVFEEISVEDLDLIHLLHSFPKVDKYNTLGIPSHLEETKQLILGWIKAQQEVPPKKQVFRINNREKQFVGVFGITFGKPGYKSAEF